MYANQLSYDLKAYMKHRENTTTTNGDDENDKALLKEDVILLMKRYKNRKIMISWVERERESRTNFKKKILL